MWFVRMLATLILFVILLGFSILNASQKTTVALWWGQRYDFIDVPLIVVLFIAFVLGLFVWFIVTVLKDVRMRKAVSDIRRENTKLEAEIKALRNMPVEDITGPADEDL